MRYVHKAHFICSPGFSSGLQCCSTCAVYNSVLARRASTEQLLANQNLQGGIFHLLESSKELKMFTPYAWGKGREQEICTSKPQLSVEALWAACT
eukprot:131473-Pelagomonas_calceolata.AAC.5